MHCMDTGAEPLAHAIGARVKQQRMTRRWTLDQLASYAGVSRRVLVNVEQGAVNPRVGTLLLTLGRARRRAPSPRGTPGFAHPETHP